MSQNGKGSKPRLKSVNQKIWEENYDRIFSHGKRIQKKKP